MSKSAKLLTSFQERMGWVIGGKSAVGQVDGYWFSLTQMRNIEPAIVSVTLSNPETGSLENLKNAFMSEKKKYRLAKIVIEDNNVFFTVNADTNSDMMYQKTANLIKDLAEYFKVNSLLPGCKICGENVLLNAVKISEYSYGVCDPCFGEVQKELEEKAYSNELQGNYFTGIIGAMAGAFIGALLWMAVSYIGFYASIVGFVMAFLSHKGYELLKGRIGRGMPFIIAVSVIIGVIFANILEIALLMSLDPETGLSFLEAFWFSFQALYNTEVFYVGQVWSGIGFGLLFAVLGSYRKIKEIFESTKPEYYSVERL